MVKEEIVEAGEVSERFHVAPPPPNPVTVIELSSSDSDSDGGDEGEEGDGGFGMKFRVFNDGGGPLKRLKSEKGVGIVLPLGFLDPLPPEESSPMPMHLPGPVAVEHPAEMVVQSCRQFWKAGDYEGGPVSASTSFSAGIDRVRVHPKFLHSNATSHKWALGAFAELLDNSLDEVCHGSTYVNVDMLNNQKDGNKMLLVEDNGGGMDPDKMRQCMSLGYSAKSKTTNTIGQYGNGFKTSTMRLGADVIVFSRCRGKEGRSPTQSIGLLSYTFLRNTGKEDIVVPMLDYEGGGQIWNRMTRSSLVDWNNNLETIIQWSPYLNEADLLLQFSSMTDQGTRIVIYNLWLDDEGKLELDFNADKHDIQIRGVNRDEKKIQMAKEYPNSRHFLTYRHSLRSYASILYLRLPRGFRMTLRGEEIEHHNIVNDMMLKQEVTYRPQTGVEGAPKDSNMFAVVTIGFVKDAKSHIDVQGFNVYHKNRLIKPFWRVWNAAGSDGRGVIGVLEANFVEPAHDKQGFERTTVLSRLEAKLVLMQKRYWNGKCQEIGYAQRRSKNYTNGSHDKEISREDLPRSSSRPSMKDASAISASPLFSKSPDSARPSDKDYSHTVRKMGKDGPSPIGSASNAHFSAMGTGIYIVEKVGKNICSPQLILNGRSPASDESYKCIGVSLVNESGGPKGYETEENYSLRGGGGADLSPKQPKVVQVTCNGNGPSFEDSDVSVKHLKDENEALKDRIKKMEDLMVQELQCERDRSRSLAEQLEAAEGKLEEANKEQEALIDIFSEERSRRDREEENLRKKLRDASSTIQDLIEKLNSNWNGIKLEH